MPTVFVFAAHFEYWQHLHSGMRPAELSFPSFIGAADVVSACLRHRPDAVVLKVTSVQGEIVGYAPGGLVCWSAIPR